MCGWRKGEQEYPRIQKPKMSLASEHAVPPLPIPVVHVFANARIFAEDDAHSLKFRE